MTESLAQEAYVAFVQICKGGSDDAGTYDADEAIVRRALKRLDELESAALAEPEPEPVPVAWCRTDEFSNAMKRGGSFNGWKDPGAGANRCDMRLYAFPPQPH